MIRYKKILLVLCFLSITGIRQGVSQNIGVNNPTPDPSAILDITSSDKGLLAPRVALTSTLLTTPVTTPATGLLVFNTAVAGVAPNNVTPGFYFWDGSKWQRFDTGGNGNDWNTNGNGGTNAAVNFLGTTDNQDLIFKRNNTLAGLLSPSNTSFGTFSMTSITSGIQNTAVGNSIMINTNTGSKNIGVGSFALANNTSGSNNTAVGFNALLINNTGISNVAVGIEALRSNSSGSNSVAIGDSALRVNTASGNVAVGSKAGLLNTNGSRNTFIGFAVGKANLFGSSNTGVGSNAMPTNIGGSFNTAIGDSALFENTNGVGNTALGVKTGKNNTTGASNVFIGSEAGSSNVTGSVNTYVGVLSGRSATGSFNAFFGQFSGANVSSGTGNTIIGHSTASGLTTGNNSTVVGWRAGLNMGLGSYNSLFGDSASVSSINISNATAIGSKSFVQGSNKMVLGSVAGVNGATSNVDVGIGTNFPLDRLHVVGNIRMVDGNQAAGKVLMSDANGTGSWQEVPGKTTFYTAVGTTNATATGSFVQMPEMAITFTPKDSIVLIHFSASGFSVNCGQNGIFFRVLLNNSIPVLESQTSVEDITGIPNKPIWDINLHGSVAVVANTPQTITVEWLAVSCGGIQNLVASPSNPYHAHRALTVIDPVGPGGISGTPQVVGDLWSVNGNAGLTSANFLGTVDATPLQLRQNNNRVGFFDGTNAFLGTSAGLVNTSTNNTFIGRLAGFDNTIGFSNTFLGNSSGTNNISGSQNTMLGNEAGFQSTAGSLNTFVGTQAGRSNGGSSNAIVGAQAGFSSSGNEQVFVGANAGRFLTGNTNVALGFQAGFTATAHTGTNNVYLGSNTNSPTPGASNSVAIGANATFQASNAIVLGAISGANGATVTHNVGIGTSVPVRRLHVANNGISGGLFNGFTIAAFENSSTCYLQTLTPDANENGILFGRTSLGIGAAVIYNNSTLPDGLIFRSGGNVNRMFLTSTGNLGIGIAAPFEKLEVAGNVEASGDFYAANSNGVINCGGGNMNALINIIADAVPTPLNANGDEDLYIADVLELGGQGFKPGGGSWAAASDRRLKKDIVDFKDGLDQVLAIHPVSYKYNDHFKSLNDGKTYIGVLAQEIKEVAPYTVELRAFGQMNQEDENGNETIVKQGEQFYTYDASALPYMLINAVKELKSANDQQNKLIEELRKEIENLKQTR